MFLQFRIHFDLPVKQLLLRILLPRAAMRSRDLRDAIREQRNDFFDILFLRIRRLKFYFPHIIFFRYS